MNTIILTGGGTAGHVAPNLALIPYLKDYEIHYIGEEGGMEERLVSAVTGVHFHSVPCIKLRRSLSVRNLKIPFTLIKGISQAKKLIAQIQPKVVFSKGGYAALPAAIAAIKSKIPLVIHESDASMGLANKLVAKKSDVVCAAFPWVAEQYKNGTVAGTPVRKELYCGNAKNVYNSYGFKRNGKSNLLVFGGSSGALALNKAVEEALTRLCGSFNVLHIAGEHGFNVSNDCYNRISFSNNMQDCYAWADYVVCRAGAGTLTEITALKKPSIVVPLPKSGTSRGDQVQNAEYYKNLGMITVLRQEDLNGDELIKRLNELPKLKPSLISAMNAATPLYGAQKIADILNSYNK